MFEARLPLARGGEHRIAVRDPVSKEDVEVNFQVTGLSAERRSAVRNVALQDELALATGGKTYDLTTVAALPRDVVYEPKTETTIKVLPVWNTTLCFALVIALMLGEWFIRKLVNLP